MKWLATMKWTIGTAALASLFVGVFSLLPDHEAHAQATACFDFTTGGGWFQSSFGDGKANFGFNVGYKNGPDSPLRGEFNLVDHAANVTIKALTIDTYGGEGNGTGHRCSPNQSCDRFWTGTAEITFPDAVFVCSLVVEVVDRGRRIPSTSRATRQPACNPQGCLSHAVSSAQREEVRRSIPPV